MIRNTVLVTRTYYYPLGNTPAVSLTQDLPPEQDADILLLGCGDVRNILFTCFADAARKIDVTCCDIEPGIHARNILLYSLLIEDKENLNIGLIWNIYYHWKLDKNSVEFLENQVQKLLEVSKSMNEWHGSVYGSSIRFCDERTLSLVRSYWNGFRLRGLSSHQRKLRQNKLQTAFDRAKTLRDKMVKSSSNRNDLRATSPVLGQEIIPDLTKILKQWWDCGTTPSSGTPVLKAADLNPAFWYTPNHSLTLHYGQSPISGFPLSTAYIPIAKGSPSFLEHRGASAERLINCAKNHLGQWASAFRKALRNKSVIRLFCGDALAFGLALRHCQLAQPTQVNLFCDNWTSSPLKLHKGDYGDNKNGAPMKFDIVDTSNLVDHLGPLNVMGVASSLLKHNACSCLYTEMLLQFDSNLSDRLSAFFGVDARSVSLLLGLALPDLFTNATDSFDYDSMLDRMGTAMGRILQYPQTRSRLRWRRLRGYQASNDFPCIYVEPKPLAMLLNQIHDAMFSYEDPTSMMNLLMPGAISKQANLCYNRASFAVFLNLLRATAITDWDQCVKGVYANCFCFDSMSSIKTNCAQDLLLHMHLNGVDNGEFDKPSPADVRTAILAPVLPFRENEDVPDQLCVTVRVSRQKLGVFTRRNFDKIGTPALVCNFDGQDPNPWANIFSSVQVTYGKWHEGTEDSNSYPFIEEDSSHLFGTSDMFISVYVPTLMLLQSKQHVPRVNCGLIRNSQNFMIFMGDLGPNLYFTSNEMTDKDVFITHYMPGMSSLPVFALVSAREDKVASIINTVQLSEDGTQVDMLIQRISLESEAAKATLANSSSAVEIEFKTPLIATVSIANSQELLLEFPVPVSPSKFKIRIARKSSYIEIVSPLFHPLKEDALSFIFPTCMTKVSQGTTVPMPWTSTRIDLDAMPPIDLKNIRTIPWLNPHVFQMFSEWELRVRQSNAAAEVDVRTSIKDTVFSIFMSYVGLQGKQDEIFGLSKPVGGNHTLIFPSYLRLDVVNRTFVLDVALMPLTEAMFSNPKAVRFFKELTNLGLMSFKISERENHAWKAMMPALVERCRTASTWKHSRDCEYIQACEVPLTEGLNNAAVSSICSCGIGKFPSGDYLKSQTKKLSELSYMIKQYATRAAIGPIFTVPYVENCSLREIPVVKEMCMKCGTAGDQGLMACSRCKAAKYCSKECQKADWKNHKPTCVAV